ncbi:MAG TPA: tryptophan synthase subunit alpha, partial [Candidatus Micrarchaeota archaeon]|nr:tryptophan synthase subunit alpha [Candidatus Micrarchaeota archaeon]
SKTAFMPYVCCGDPDAAFTIELAMALEKAGAGAIELGIPFSDPIADGKTIQAASARALGNGMTPIRALETLARIRAKGVKLPIFLMTYYNVIYSQGTEAFAKMAKAAGANGLIVPDAPVEETPELTKACKKNGLGIARFINPNSTDAEIRKAGKLAQGGFLYAVAVFGTTGAKKAVDRRALNLVRRAKKLTGAPIAAGFGISSPANAREFAACGANGVIIGSAIADLYSKSAGKGKAGRKAALAKTGAFAKSIARACQA